MNFTFGVITEGSNYGLLNKALDAIANNFYDDEANKFEVIVVGGNDYENDGNFRVIPFNESIKKAWITKKKNIITKEAQYENIVYMHDYIALDDQWYRGFCKFGNDFDICITPIINADGTRYRDWTLWPDDITHILGPWNSKYLLPYDVSHLSKYMYISGAYWIAKKSVMEKFPLDENLSWGESEDVIWSKQVREHYKFKLNTHSVVKLLKQKERIFNEITDEMLKTLHEHIKNK